VTNTAVINENFELDTSKFRGADIPVGLIRIVEKGMLRGVDKTEEEYVRLRDSISRKGVLNPVVVREIKDPVTGAPAYSLVDGLQRFTSSCDLGLTTIPARIMSMADAEVLENQIVANYHRVTTKQASYAKALLSIVMSNPTLTFAELAARIGVEPAWLQQRLTLTKLGEKAKSLTDEGKITLSNAYLLAKMPEADQDLYSQQAMTLPANEFAPLAKRRIEEINKALREGRKEQKPVYVPTPKLRKMSELRDESNAWVARAQLLAAVGVGDLSTPAEGFNRGFELGVNFALSMDPLTQASEKQKFEAHQAQLEADAKKRQEERDEKKRQQLAKDAEIAGTPVAAPTA